MTITSNTKSVADRLAERYKALRVKTAMGLRVGSFNVPYAAFHEYGTRWSHQMPYGFWKAMRGQKQRSPSKNVLAFSGKGKDRMARIKARPFLAPAFETHRQRISQMLMEAMSKNPESMERVFTRIGTLMVTQIVRNIRRPPRPEGGARGPIANTGNLLNSIRYEIIR